MFLLWTALLLYSAVAHKSQESFEPQCQSHNDYGWPRFQSREELVASPWSSYFMDAYGEIPNQYPVCIYDLWILDKAAYDKANITGHKLVDPAVVTEGDLFLGALSSNYGIYHGTWKPLPDYSWVEITHTAMPTELEGFWVWRTRGSGIWYNMGKTKVFPSPADASQTHKEAMEFLMQNCSKKVSSFWPQIESDIFGFCAREKGYDSIQFEPQKGQIPLGTFDLIGLTEMVLVNIDGKYNCGVEDETKTPLREGWLASRQCDCVNYDVADSCGLMPVAPFPFSVIGSSPPLCKLQQGPPVWNRWKHCDTTTCRPTQCRVRRGETTQSRMPRDDVSRVESLTLSV